MAGYIITLSSIESLEKCVETGTYSTILTTPINDSWRAHHEGTFADFLSMKEGDQIFFFIQRKIFGCGQLIKVGAECKYLNYENADDPSEDGDSINHLLPYGSAKNRCFCTFQPFPYFFRKGIDMDEVLQNTSSPFRSLRTLWKLSFIKVDDEESDALYRIIIKHNENYLNDKGNHFVFNDEFLNSLNSKLEDVHRLNSLKLISSSADNNLKSKHEMSIEAALCERLSVDDIPPFGKWDYISHQVVASPFKPIDYMDKMDIFGYRYITGHKIKSKYLIIEIKKDEATLGTVEQIMKYVDWVANEYVNGDYSMIKAYLVASNYPSDIVMSVNENCVRNFTKGYRPTEFCKWNDISLVQYMVVGKKLKLKLFNENKT